MYHFSNLDPALLQIMDQADALLNLQPQRSTRQTKPKRIPIFFIPIQISVTNAVCFCIISLHLQILPGKTIVVVTISVPWSSQPPSNQTSSQSVLKKSLKTDSGHPYEADLQRQLYDLQLRDEQAELLTHGGQLLRLFLPNTSQN